MSEKQRVQAVDFHCHVDLHSDPAAVVASCERERIITLAVTTTPKAWPQNRRWADASEYVHPAPGLHPELVGERHQEITLLEKYIEESRLIGEIGLDGSPQHRRSWPMQMEVFVRVLVGAQRLGERVVSIHSRRAASEVVKCIEEHTTVARVLSVLHWFSGSITVAHRAAKLGCYFSINRPMLEHETGVALVRSLPEDRLLTESDAPFTSRVTISYPSDVLATAERLAAARGVSAEAMRETLTANALRVLKFARMELTL